MRQNLRPAFRCDACDAPLQGAPIRVWGEDLCPRCARGEEPASVANPSGHSRTLLDTLAYRLLSAAVR
ncbi:MAG TPA: hypothetical protein VIN09_07210 [Chloroflexota bacterium]